MDFLLYSKYIKTNLPDIEMTVAEYAINNSSDMNIYIYACILNQKLFNRNIFEFVYLFPNDIPIALE